ncbi:MAG TPA: NUDIX domain-containing protein [Byssovorax sp.]|jgi:8-oxo-dGTP diphosphatase
MRKRNSSSAAGAPPAAEDEAAFLAAYDVTAFERPSLAVDVVVLTVEARALRVLLLRRAAHPHRGAYALPGGFVGMTESIDGAATRVLRDKAGLDGVFVEQLYTFGAPGRDPRTRVVSVAHYALVDARLLARPPEEEPDPDRVVADVVVPWAGETGGPVEVAAQSGARLALAFDHADVIGAAVKRLRGKLDYTPVGFQLLPRSFTLRDLQDVHEVVRGEELNKDSFRRRMLAGGLLEATGEREQATTHRPAELYRFVRRSAV